LAGEIATMHGNQFTNVLTLAAALSMAGWVARPDGNQNHLTNFNNQNYNYQNRFHPYQQPQANQLRSNNHLQQQQQFQNGPLVAQAVAPQYNLNPNSQNNLYQSKDAEDTFRAYLELQELISWQESYRRGDLMPQQNTNQQFVLPVSNPESIENKFSSGNDDGYGTCSSVGSPASTTQLGSEVDNLSVRSNSPSPQPNTFNFDQDLNGQSQPFQQINSPLEDGVFDIDEILNDEQGAMSPVMPYNDEIPKGPFASLLSSLDQDLEYADSPALKNPSFDSFLTKPSPEYKPPYTYSQKYEDPFNIKFTNGSLPEGFSQETLVDIGNFDPSIFEENTESQDDILDKALVQSLHQKENPATVAIKQEEDDDYWLRPQSPMVEHDYFNRDEMKPLQTANPITKHQPQIIQRPVTFAPNRRQQPLPMIPTTTRIRGGRTFAPSHSATASGLSYSKPSSIKPKVKQQKQKSFILWNDFQYTALDLVEMPVEKFNEVIKQLDEVRQHIAKDERRKGKNKLAARHCRKRKMDVIENLDSGVNILEQKRQELLKERQRILDETRQIKLKTEWLNDYIFKHIKDSNGLPYNENDYSLKYTADGNVYVVPVGVGNNGN